MAEGRSVGEQAGDPGVGRDPEERHDADLLRRTRFAGRVMEGAGVIAILAGIWGIFGGRWGLPAAPGALAGSAAALVIAGGLGAIAGRAAVANVEGGWGRRVGLPAVLLAVFVVAVLVISRII